MELTQNYKKAFTEVYTILNLLDREEYKKIPKKIISVIEKNRDYNYKYEINKDMNLCNTEMLAETKAILFNLFRDYLATTAQKQKIIEIQRKERERRDREKRKVYNIDDIFKVRQNKIEEIFKKDNTLIKVKKDGLIRRIINKLKQL